MMGNGIMPNAARRRSGTQFNTLQNPEENLHKKVNKIGKDS